MLIFFTINKTKKKPKTQPKTGFFENKKPKPNPNRYSKNLNPTGTRNFQKKTNRNPTRLWVGDTD